MGPETGEPSSFSPAHPGAGELILEFSAPVATRGCCPIQPSTFGDLSVVTEATAEGDGDGWQVPQAVGGALHTTVDARASHRLW